MTGQVIVVGLGEIGRPLLEIIQARLPAVGVDLAPAEIAGGCEVLHICYPHQIRDFVGTSAQYIRQYRPQLTIVNSTVPPGTTRAIWRATNSPIANSPVRGKHARMKEELLHYVKFVGGIDDDSAQSAARHFESVGMKTRVLSSPEATELAKLTETTYFGLLVVWAQEVERYCDQLKLDYDEVTSYYGEIRYLPPVQYWPGVIGGHCVMPNIALLKEVFDSGILDAMEHSNALKAAREAATHSDSSPASARRSALGGA